MESGRHGCATSMLLAPIAQDIGEDHSPETHLIPLVLDGALGVRKAIRIFVNAILDGTSVRDYVHVLI